MSFQRSADVIARREGEQTLVFHQKTGAICILNPCSTFIWEALGECSSADEITERVKEHFRAPSEGWDDVSVLHAIEQHLALMDKAQLVEACESDVVLDASNDSQESRHGTF